MKTSTISKPILRSLEALAVHDKAEGIKSKFDLDSKRADQFSFDIEQFFIDMSKTHISKDLVQIYQEFAEEIGFADMRESFLRGSRINNSEDRAVLHALLRDPENQSVKMIDDRVLTQAAGAKAEYFSQYKVIRDQLAARPTPIKDIVHVGIGGSSLGTQLIFEALNDLGSAIKIHFVGNIDGHQLVDVLAQCDVKSTLVVGVSKTFTTAETLQNLDSIAQWFRSGAVANPLSCFYGFLCQRP